MFQLYLDESQTRQDGNSAICLAGIVIKAEDHDKQLIPQLQTLKSKIWADQPDPTSIVLHDVPYHRGRVGLNHLALWAESRDQVNALTEQVRARGLRVLHEDRHPFAGGPDHYALYFEDPDRIKVELVAPSVR